MNTQYTNIQFTSILCGILGSLTVLLGTLFFLIMVFHQLTVKEYVIAFSCGITLIICGSFVIWWSVNMYNETLMVK